MIRIYQEARRSHGKKTGMYRVRCGVECIFRCKDQDREVPLPLLLQEKTGQAAKRILESRPAAVLFSAAMTWAVYRYCAALAWIERGGKVAYGGECLVALAAGWITCYAIRRWQGRR